MCTVLLPSDGYPIAVKKYISYLISDSHRVYHYMKIKKKVRKLPNLQYVLEIKTIRFNKELDSASVRAESVTVCQC
jgi:hypothetical protein